MGRCIRCHGFLTPDAQERDGTLCCINCGYIAWPASVLEESRSAAAHVKAPRRRRARR
jgi:DNA-directed RNA polymerase subunit M/transcription elongation factor TFIIS